MGILKKRLEEKKGAWIEELHGVIWAYRTIVKTSIRETPFALAYDNEVVILVEVGMPSHRTQHFNVEQSVRALDASLDLLEEKRDDVETRAASNIKKMEQYFNKIVKPKVLQNRRFGLEEGKLSPR